MDAIKRKLILKALKSGHSALNISGDIGAILNQPQEDILRILKNSQWGHKELMITFDMFGTAHNKINYVDDMGRTLTNSRYYLMYAA